MPIEHPPPTEATVKYLYAHAFRCAYEGCQRPLYRQDEQTGTKTLNSRVCHINARREGGPRWDPDQSVDDNRSEQNLVLMCVEHAGTIDQPATLSAYSAERLRQWKAKQFNAHDKLKQGWTIDTDMAREVIRASFSNAEIVVNNSTVNVGGEGGKAPSAGGGGGGAIGRGARGGRGGDGGGHRIDDGEYTLPWAEDASIPRLMDQLPFDFNPGAGGGGTGAIGDGATGGDGGAGGECVSAHIDLAELKKAGLDRIQAIVGKGGCGSRLPGQHGTNGEDTVLNFLARDGTILKTLRASGGAKGRSGSHYLPDGVVELSPEDINDGFRITPLMTVNAAELRDGLLFILGGDWVQFLAPQIPFEAVWPVVCGARWRTLKTAVARGMFLSLIHPAGHETSCQALIIPAEATPQGSRRWPLTIGATIDAEGAWTLRVHSGGFLLAEVNVRVLISS
jgi:hypothetical protein